MVRCISFVSYLLLADGRKDSTDGDSVDPGCLCCHEICLCNRNGVEVVMAHFKRPHILGKLTDTDAGVFYNATMGYRTQYVLVLTTNHAVSSKIQPVPKIIHRIIIGTKGMPQSVEPFKEIYIINMNIFPSFHL